MLYKIPEVVTCLELLAEVCTWPRATTHAAGSDQWETEGCVGCGREDSCPEISLSWGGMGLG